ncbi:MAG: hypothetical protein UU18_C0015G0009 [Parcubacteria group bacterium GW2011_GWB2_40_8]|nr:MAG: hypothetical protein UU18_C0015G0009 [Parcubacteria group bacterium GW2011_GWB2_40_8]
MQYTAGVDPDGEVYLCSPWSRKEYSIGNINQSSIRKIWGSNKHVEIAAKLSDNLQSGKCSPSITIIFLPDSMFLLLEFLP